MSSKLHYLDADSTKSKDLANAWDAIVSQILEGRRVGDAHHFCIRGDWTLTRPLDCTGFRGGLTIDAQRSEIKAAFDTPDVAIDLTGSIGVRIDDLRLIGDADKPPLVGMLLCRSERNGREQSAGNHRFTRVVIAGSFACSAVYNVASESNHWYSPRFDNASGSYSLYLGKFFDREFPEGFRIRKEGNSSGGSRYYGLHVVDRGEATGGAVHIAGFRHTSFADPYIASARRSQIVIDTQRITSIGIDVRGGYLHGAENTGPDAAVRIEGTHEVAGANFDFKVITRGRDQGIHVDTSEVINCQFRWTNAVPLTFSERTRLFNVRADTYQSGELRVPGLQAGDLLYLNGERVCAPLGA